MQLKLLQKFVYLFVFILLGGALGYAGGLGCETAGPVPPGPTPTPTPTVIPTASPTPTPPVDVVMGDPPSNRVVIFYDVLAEPIDPTASPDVVLDTADITTPARVIIDNVNDLLIVANTENPGSILIYNGFTSLTQSPTPTPDVILNNSATQVDNVTDIALAPGAVGNDLYVANLDSVILTGSNVTIFHDIATVASPDPADVSLDMDVVDAQALIVAGNRLFICDGSDNEILIHNNADALAGNPPPNEVLTSGVVDCFRIKVFDDVLYVLNGNNTLTAYSPASTLTSVSTPDFTLDGGAGSQFSDPEDIFAAGRLFVAQNNATDVEGVLGFAPPFMGNQIPDVELVNPIEDCRGIDGVLGTLFVACDPPGLPVEGVYGYLNAGGITSGGDPDINLLDSPSSIPEGLDVEIRLVP